MPRSTSTLGESIPHPPITTLPDSTLTEQIAALNCTTEPTMTNLLHGNGEKDILQHGKRRFTGDSVTCWHWVKLQHIRQGACIGVSDSFLDWLFDYDKQVLSDWALKVKSLPNPNRVGTLDAFIAWMDVPHATLYREMPPGHPMAAVDAKPIPWACHDLVGTKDCEAAHWHNGDGRGWVTFYTRVPFGITATMEWLRKALTGYDAAPLPGRGWRENSCGFAVWPHDPTYTGDAAPAHSRSRRPHAR